MQVQSPIAAIPATGAAPADPGKRVVARLIDCAPMVLAIIPIVGCVVVLAMLVYLFIRDGLGNGAGFGKRVMKVRVVDFTTGQKASFGQSAIREVVYLIPFFGIVELVMLLTRPDRRRFGDQWANTVVIDGQ